MKIISFGKHAYEMGKYVDIEKCECRTNIIESIDFEKFKDKDLILVEPMYPNFTAPFLWEVKAKSGLPLIGKLQMQLDSYLGDRNKFFNLVWPYLQVFDGIITSNEGEVSMFKHLTGKPCTYVGSRVDFDSMKTINKPVRNNEIAQCAMFWWKNAQGNTMVAKHFKELGFIDFLSQNITEEIRQEQMKYYVMLGHVPTCIPKLTLSDYWERLSQCKVAINLENRHGQSKFSLDCAVTGVPCVGGNTLTSMQKLWPDLTVDAFDLDGAIVKMKRLLEDEQFYNDCIKKAQANLQYFNAKDTTSRFVGLCKEVIELSKNV